jgi:hypothetical protein
VFASNFKCATHHDVVVMFVSGSRRGGGGINRNHNIIYFTELEYLRITPTTTID